MGEGGRVGKKSDGCGRRPNNLAGHPCCTLLTASGCGVCQLRVICQQPRVTKGPCSGRVTATSVTCPSLGRFLDSWYVSRISDKPDHQSPGTKKRSLQFPCDVSPAELGYFPDRVNVAIWSTFLV